MTKLVNINLISGKQVTLRLEDNKADLLLKELDNPCRTDHAVAIDDGLTTVIFYRNIETITVKKV